MSYEGWLLYRPGETVEGYKTYTDTNRQHPGCNNTELALPRELVVVVGLRVQILGSSFFN